jgi:Holliday junction DNA helicase RuvB
MNKASEEKMSEDLRFISSSKSEQDLEIENTLRPQAMTEYIGQEKIKTKLAVYITAAKARKEPLDHVLLYGPPGLGKTTLAHIIANELGVQFRVTSGPAIEKAGDLAAILTKLGENDVLFIDEIHRLNKSAEEILYSAMEDFCLDLILGKGPSAQSMRLKLQPFTLIGATTRAGNLSGPLRDRFGIIERLDMYAEEDLGRIIRRSAKILSIGVGTDAEAEMAKRSRGTPRIANRILKRVRDCAEVKGGKAIDIKTACESLEMMEIDNLGLDYADKMYLTSLISKFSGGPAGLSTLAAATGEESVTLEDIVEPYLLRLGFIARTPRGRVALAAAYKHLGLAVPSDQISFFDEGTNE